jgi:chromosome segregation ATPase
MSHDERHEEALDIIEEDGAEIRKLKARLERSRNRVEDLKGHLTWIGWSEDGVIRAKAEIERLQIELKQARIDYDAAYREWSARDNRQSAEIERMERENRELRHAIADVVTNDPIVAAVVSIGEELDLSDDEEDEYEHDEEDEYAEWSTDE